jgi:hypothetical protein
MGGAIGDFLAGFELANLTAEGIRLIDDGLRDLYHRFMEAPEAFDLAGMSIDDFIDAILDLDKAADSVAASVKTAAQTMQDNIGALGNTERIFGTDPTKHAIGLAGASGYTIGGIPDAAARDALVAWFKELFSQLSKEEQAGAQGRGFADIIESLLAIQFGGAATFFGGIKPGEIGAMSHGFQSLTTTQGDRLADLELRQLNVMTDIRDDVRKWMKIQMPSAQQFPSVAGASPGGPNVGSIIGSLTVNVTAPAGTSGSNIGSTVGKSIVREIDEQLGRKTILQQLYNGDISMGTARDQFFPTL